MKKDTHVLCVLDGWGVAKPTESNAIAAAYTPCWDQITHDFPLTTLEASGPSVGLPPGQMGNSEVGHMHMGAGRIVPQDLPRIDDAILSGDFDHALQRFIRSVKAKGGACHVMGLLSKGGVHGHIDHIKHLCLVLAEHTIPVYLHGFLDGRDTPPQSAQEELAQFLEDIHPLSSKIKIASLSGRFYAMDRDNRWDRIEKTYRALTQGRTGETPQFTDPLLAIQHAYDQGITDEFIPPMVAENYAGPQNHDGVLMANFRADRAREILCALGSPDFQAFERSKPIAWSAFMGMTSYGDETDTFCGCLFPPQNVSKSLGEYLATCHKNQLRIAETEKYAHVTFFFNGGREPPFEAEDRILVPSPKVDTYDQAPEMSAQEVTDHVLKAIGNYDFILVNYANADMVGHTGNMEAAKQAVSCLDTCLGRLQEGILKKGGTLYVTADHGNVEHMYDDDPQAPHTSHTVSKVPFALIGTQSGQYSLGPGTLTDIAPTLLEAMGLQKPPEMTGRSLLRKK